MAAMSFEERLALLVDREIHCCRDRKRVRLPKLAHLKYPLAVIEDIDVHLTRGTDRRTVMSLALGDWVTSGLSVLIIDPAGVGKWWLACALAICMPERGYSNVYLRVPRCLLPSEITHLKGEKSKRCQRNLN